MIGKKVVVVQKERKTKKLPIRAIILDSRVYRGFLLTEGVFRKQLAMRENTVAKR